MYRSWLVLGVASGLLVAAAPATAAKAKKNAALSGVVESISGDTIALKGFEERPDGSAANFEKKLKLTPNTKFVTVQGRGKKAEESAAARTDVRTGMKVEFIERDGTAEKILIRQKGKKK